MSLPASIAIWFLFFVAVAFVSLSFGVRTDEEAGTAKVAGQAAAVAGLVFQFMQSGHGPMMFAEEGPIRRHLDMIGRWGVERLVAAVADDGLAVGQDHISRLRPPQVTDERAGGS